MGTFGTIVLGCTGIKNRKRVALYTECRAEKLLGKSFCLERVPCQNATGGTIAGTARNISQCLA
jgi:hypothetical protein